MLTIHFQLVPVHYGTNGDTLRCAIRSGVGRASQVGACFLRPPGPRYLRLLKP
jgi:hypothetical protein